MLRGGGKQKAKYRRTSVKQLIPVRRRTKSPSRSSSKKEPKSASKKRQTMGRTQRIPKSALLLSTLAVAGAYSTPTEFFLNHVAACDRQSEQCWTKVHQLATQQHPMMTNDEKEELNWAKKSMKIDNFRNNELKKRIPKKGKGASVPKWLKSVKNFKESAMTSAKYGAAGLALASGIKAIGQMPAIKRNRMSKVENPRLMYSRLGPWQI